MSDVPTTTEPAADRAVAGTPRRTVLAAALGGAAALVASALGRPAATRAAAGQAVIQGQVNNAGGTATTVTSTLAGQGAIVGTNSNATGRGVVGQATAASGINAGVFGTTATGSGRGVFGKATRTSGIAQGVRGEVASPDGFGVYAKAATVTGVGAAIRADGGGNTGLAVSSEGASTAAIVASHSLGSAVIKIGTPGTGLRIDTTFDTPIRAESTNAIAGIFYSTGTALQANSTGSAYGVSAYSPSGIGCNAGSNSGKGVHAYSTSGNGIHAASQSNDGVLGTSSSLSGVAGASSTGAGVYGESEFGWGGYFVGDTNVTGTLSKGAGSFVIDHPLDPEGKILRHSFVESPDMMDIYNGNVRLDDRGEAVVELPAWFEALNRDFRYQLTGIGDFVPAYVRDEVRDNRFTIAGGKAGQRVSWQVTGVRRDAFAEANRIVVEEAKPAAEQGTYLHPKAFGRPESVGRDFPLRERYRVARSEAVSPPPTR